MEVRTLSYANAFGEEQEVMEFRIKNGDGSNQYVEVHALLNAFAESTLNFLKVEDVIKSVPKSDVAPVVHGEWLEKEVVDNTDEDFVWKIESWQSARCSVCGKYHTTPYVYYFDNFNYCPNCGARMDGE